jgi:hypothetical protein
MSLSLSLSLSHTVKEEYTEESADDNICTGTYERGSNRRMEKIAY